MGNHNKNTYSVQRLVPENDLAIFVLGTGVVLRGGGECNAFPRGRVYSLPKAIELLGKSVVNVSSSSLCVDSKDCHQFSEC